MRVRTSQTSRPWVTIAASTLATILLAGCTVLTDRQVDAVAQFADATQNFGTSPETVMIAHSDLRRERGLLRAATRTNADAAADDLEKSLAQQQGLTRLAHASSIAMGVLDDYAEMLTVLASSKFTDDLQNKTVQLGTSIDNGIAAFNKASGSQLSSFGDVVAGIVRGAGGIWIRHEQARAVTAAVTGASQPVIAMTVAIEKLMAEYIGPAKSDSPAFDLFASESRDVRGMFPRLRAGRSWDIATLERVQRFHVASRDGAELARSCAAAAQEYRAAHAELVRAVTDKHQDLTGLIDQIRVLADEVKAGKRVRDEIKKSRES
jgi:hypothetical protein